MGQTSFAIGRIISRYFILAGLEVENFQEVSMKNGNGIKYGQLKSTVKLEVEVMFTLFDLFRMPPRTEFFFVWELYVEEGMERLSPFFWGLIFDGHKCIVTGLTKNISGIVEISSSNISTLKNTPKLRLF